MSCDSILFRRASSSCCCSCKSLRGGGGDAWMYERSGGFGFLGFFLPHKTCPAAAAESCSVGKRAKEGALIGLSGSPPSRLVRPQMQAYASGVSHTGPPENYVLNLPCFRIEESAHERAVFFSLQQRELAAATNIPQGRRATSLSDLMFIRSVHGKLFRRLSLGTAIGFRTKGSKVTDVPAIIVFVARKLNAQWVLDGQMLPNVLQAPGGVWCDVDVVEFSYHGQPTPGPKEEVYSELVECLRGNDSQIGPGSQVSGLAVYGTLGALVRSKIGRRQVGFITNRHVAVDLDYPYQKIFHPLPPNLGPGVYLGAVERATSFITDDIWYGMYAGSSSETFVRADGAFVPFSSTFDGSCLTTSVKGLGEIGELLEIDLNARIDCVVGKAVVKVGRSSGLTTGTIVAYGVEYHDDKGICFFTDLLVVGDDRKEFDMEGDSGSLILMRGEDGEKARPMGMIWGGTSNRGRLKLREGFEPENWTSGVDLGRLLQLLQLELISCDVALEDFWNTELAEPYVGDVSEHKDKDGSRNPQSHAGDLPESSNQGAAAARRIGIERSTAEIVPLATEDPSTEEPSMTTDDVSLHLSLSPPKAKRTRLS